MEPHGRIQKIGVLVGGGPAPGINSVIHAVTMEAERNHIEVFGIDEGFKYLMEGKLAGSPLTSERVAYIYSEGGSIIHTARANPTRRQETLENCVNTLNNAGINALVSIGGDDTAYSASQVARCARYQMGVDLRSVHVPKTIDNDLPLPEDVPTFGYETAREVGTRMMMNLKRDAATIRHWFLVQTMGRQSGHLALGIGVSATATVTLIPEEWPAGQVRLREVVDILVTTILMRLLQDKPYGVAVLAEGLLENLDPADLQAFKHIDHDEHGHIRLADVNFLDLVKKGIEDELGKMGIQLKLVKHHLGYELRCASPCAYDIEYTRSLGGATVDYLLEGGTNAIITLQRGQIVPIPFDEMIDSETGRTEVRMVNTESFRYQSAFKFMTRLKREHAADERLFEQLSLLAGMSRGDFIARYGYLAGI